MSDKKDMSIIVNKTYKAMKNSYNKPCAECSVAVESESLMTSSMFLKNDPTTKQWSREDIGGVDIWGYDSED